MPTTRQQEYVRPTTVEAAVDLIRRGPRVAIVGGGTDLLLRIPPQTEILVDLSDLELDYVAATPDGVRVGAMTTLTTMAEDRALASIAGGVIPAMMVHVGSPLIRNLATIGGHLVRGRLSDIVPVLAVLDTHVTYSDGTIERTVPLLDFYEHGTNRAPILLTEATIPPDPPGAAASFRRFSLTAYDMALMNCAVWVTRDGGKVSRSRIVFGDTPAIAAPAPDAARLLVGNELDPRRNAEVAALAAAEISVGNDGYASDTYRRNLAEVLARRCLDDLNGAGP
jgi:CO/xanthine dehydrogenase FAD-binding subunit